jgi:hypothetical protein
VQPKSIRWKRCAPNVLERGIRVPDKAADGANGGLLYTPLCGDFHIFTPLGSLLAWDWMLDLTAAWQLGAVCKLAMGLSLALESA